MATTVRFRRGERVYRRFGIQLGEVIGQIAYFVRMEGNAMIVLLPTLRIESRWTPPFKVVKGWPSAHAEVKPFQQEPPVA